jgi:hypothetical protein
MLLSCGPTPGHDAASVDTRTTSDLTSSTDRDDPPQTTGTVSTGTVSTSTGTDDGEDDTPSSGFIDSHDGGYWCSAQPPGAAAFITCECDLWAQDCYEHDKCAPWANDGTDAWNAVKCVPLDPDPDPIGAPCVVEGYVASGVDSCGLSAMCWNVDPETLEGHCVGFCLGNESDPSCEDPQDTCLIANWGRLILCLPQCDPLADDCDEGFACRPKAPSGVEPSGFVCLPTEAGGQVVDGCEALGGCPIGHACVGSNVIETCGAGCCAPYCNLNDPFPEPCSDDHVCLPLFEGDAPPGYAHVGVCGPS